METRGGLSDADQKEFNEYYNNAIETIMSMFGDIVTKDVVCSVLESCGGDLNEAIDALINMAEQNQSGENQGQNPVNNNSRTSDTAVKASTSNEDCNPTTSTSISYSKMAGTSKPKTSIEPKQQLPKQQQNVSYFWTDQIGNIIMQHKLGFRILILMRGVPGSGKSYLAEQIINNAINSRPETYKNHVFSTDDYFGRYGRYQYDRYKLSEAHSWNQDRVKYALCSGVSPVIVDNTNIEIWEMEPYLRSGVINGYIIEIVEPCTPWAKNASQLTKKNMHNVPFAKIQRMLDNFDCGVTGEYLLQNYGLNYPYNMRPPVYRLYPPIPNDTMLSIAMSKSSIGNDLVKENANKNPFTQDITQEVEVEHESDSVPPTFQETTSEHVSNYSDNFNNEELEIQTKIQDIQKQFEELEKVEQEWENGETWGDETATTVNDIASAAEETGLDPKPPRNSEITAGTSIEKVFESVNNSSDWQKLSMFMTPWNNEIVIKDNENIESIVETASHGTSVEIGDTNENNECKILIAKPRDINLFYIDKTEHKIPAKRMLDKSTTTNENELGVCKCVNGEKHFQAFIKMFRGIDIDILRDIYDKCLGDVNWAVEIIVDGMGEAGQAIIKNETLSDAEDVQEGQCDCISAYEVIPDKTRTSSVINQQTELSEVTTESPTYIPKKPKKEKPFTSQDVIQLKRQIEKNIVIPDSHYPPHCLKLRKLRYGERDDSGKAEKDRNDSDTNNLDLNKEPIASTSQIVESEIDFDDDNDSMCEVEKTVNVDLGRDFVGQIDILFGRTDMEYPENINTRINMPMSVLNEINVLWMESVSYQLEKFAEYADSLLKRDEDFARELAKKEEELAQAGKEPEIPDFKEIMDMEYALSLYQKDIAEWRSNEPKDIAARMSREKLYNLFPELSPDTLSELLMAHDNNFQMTVEVLLMSTGKGHILEEENGVNKFVVQKEMQRSGKILEEQKKVLSESEWPLLPTTDIINMDTVNSYRNEAEQHLNSRTICHNKAQQYILRGMTQVAGYYCEVADYHRKKYEHTSSLAAASLIQYHAENNPDNSTIDLHFLRVQESIVSLDLYLDTHIKKLIEYREENKQARRYKTLYIITGRGLHSPGGPRVKPAVKQRLKERGLRMSDRNPGVVTTIVNADSKLTYQLS